MMSRDTRGWRECHWKENSLGRQCASPEQKADLLTVHAVKVVSLWGQSSGGLAYCALYRFRFPKLGGSQLPRTPTVQHGDLSVSSLQNLGAKGNWCKHAEARVACCAVSDKFFVSDPGFWCLFAHETVAD